MEIFKSTGIGGRNFFLDQWLANDPLGFKKQQYEKYLQEQAKQNKKKQDEYDIDDSFLSIDVE